MDAADVVNDGTNRREEAPDASTRKSVLPPEITTDQEPDLVNKIEPTTENDEVTVMAAAIAAELLSPTTAQASTDHQPEAPPTSESTAPAGQRKVLLSTAGVASTGSRTPLRERDRRVRQGKGLMFASVVDHMLEDYEKRQLLEQQEKEAKEQRSSHHHGVPSHGAKPPLSPTARTGQRLWHLGKQVISTTHHEGRSNVATAALDALKPSPEEQEAERLEAATRREKEEQEKKRKAEEAAAEESWMIGLRMREEFEAKQRAKIMADELSARANSDFEEGKRVLMIDWKELRIIETCERHAALKEVLQKEVELMGLRLEEKQAELRELDEHRQEHLKKSTLIQRLLVSLRAQLKEEEARRERLVVQSEEQRVPELATLNELMARRHRNVLLLKRRLQKKRSLVDSRKVYLDHMGKDLEEAEERVALEWRRSNRQVVSETTQSERHMASSGAWLAKLRQGVGLEAGKHLQSLNQAILDHHNRRSRRRRLRAQKRITEDTTGTSPVEGEDQEHSGGSGSSSDYSSTDSSSAGDDELVDDDDIDLRSLSSGSDGGTERKGSPTTRDRRKKDDEVDESSSEDEADRVDNEANFRGQRKRVKRELLASKHRKKYAFREAGLEVPTASKAKMGKSGAAARGKSGILVEDASRRHEKKKNRGVKFADGGDSDGSPEKIDGPEEEPQHTTASVAVSHGRRVSAATTVMAPAGSQRRAEILRQQRQLLEKMRGGSLM